MPGFVYYDEASGLLKKMEAGNADTVGGKSVDDSKTDNSALWTAAKITSELGTRDTTIATMNTAINGKIGHALITAVNDFIVGSAAGVAVKKTLAEVKTILGLGSAAYTASTAYATAAQGTLADNALSRTNGGTMSSAINMADQILQRPSIQDYAEILGTTPATTGAVTLDLTTGNIFNITPTGDVTFAFTNPPVSGRIGSFTLYVNNGATVYAKTFPASVKWNGDMIPDMSIASKTIILVFTTKDGGTRWHGACMGSNFTT